MELRRIRPLVEEAWKKRDYKTVVDLFAPMRNRLSESERRKLEYSEQKVLP